MEHIGVVGPDLGSWRAGLQAPGSSRMKLDCCSVGPQALGVALFCNNKKKRGVGEGFARDRSDA